VECQALHHLTRSPFTIVVQFLGQKTRTRAKSATHWKRHTRKGSLTAIAPEYQQGRRTVGVLDLGLAKVSPAEAGPQYENHL
jgi:hypothetical protein